MKWFTAVFLFFFLIMSSNAAIAGDFEKDFFKVLNVIHQLSESTHNDYKPAKKHLNPYFDDCSKVVPRTPSFSQKNERTKDDINVYNNVIVIHKPIPGGGTVPKYYFVDENGKIKE